MHESKPESGLSAQNETLEGVQPSQESLVIIALLMRLYDVNLALLNHFDPHRADEIFETHQNGADFNPPVYIPQITSDDDGS